MEKTLWYFDLVSPFSYLHFHALQPLRARLDIQPVPVLFAGLLKHWGTKGPAEVPPKRLHTYQFCVWAASRHGLPFRMPGRHPFNPLQAQRLLVALGSTEPVVKVAFDFVYGEGRDPEREFAALGERLGAPGAPSLAAEPEVKKQLIANTEQAIASGVFGVSTLVVRDSCTGEATQPTGLSNSWTSPISSNNRPIQPPPRRSLALHARRSNARRSAWSTSSMHGCTAQQGIPVGPDVRFASTIADALELSGERQAWHHTRRGKLGLSDEGLTQLPLKDTDLSKV